MAFLRFLRQIPVSTNNVSCFITVLRRWSGHTHVGRGTVNLVPSDGDIKMLKYLGQKRSVVYNSVGDYAVLESEV